MRSEFLIGLGVLLLFVFSCKTLPPPSTSNGDRIDEDGNKHTVYIEDGNAPVLLSTTDLSELNIREIEVKNVLQGEESKEVKSLALKFNERGLLESFMVKEDKDSVESIISVTAQYNGYNFENGELSVTDEQLTQHFESIVEVDSKKHRFFQWTLLPFLGENGYCYFDKEDEDMKGNTIQYSVDEEEVIRDVRTDVENQLIFDLIDGDIIRSHTLNKTSEEATQTIYYYYGDNPLSTYFREEKLEYDERIKDYVDIGKTHFMKTFYKDSIYNSKRWLGYTESDFSEFNNTLKKAYYQELDEGEIVTTSFQYDHVLKIPQEDFFVNGQNGYTFLVNAFNNRNVIVSQAHYDEGGNKIPAVYKKQKEIEELNMIPENVIVQVSLTDFWFIKLVVKK